MFKRHNDELLYFSTKVELKIGNVVYRPSICYKVPPLAKASLNKFAADGAVTFYETPVRFVNGALAKVAEEQKAAGVPSVTRDETFKTAKKKGK